MSCNIFDEYISCITLLAKKAPIVLIDCDLAKVFKSICFQREYPDRYFNFGIAEQNAITAAAGMAAAGFVPIVQTFSTFISTRGCDQLRNNICFPNLGVILVGAKAGISDSYGGAVHQSIDDIGIISSIPNINVISVSNKNQLEQGLAFAVNNPKPYYFRIENNITPYNITDCLEENKLNFEHNLCIISTGSMAILCGLVVNRLKNEGIRVHLENLTNIKPINKKRIIDLLKSYSKILIVEAHNRINGLSSQVCQIAFDNNLNYDVTIKTLAINDHFTESGEYTSLLKKYDLDERSIENEIRALISIQQ